MLTHKSQKSWHHRMARLILDGYEPKCQVIGCERMARFCCEYDFMRNKKPVTGAKLFCDEDAMKFARKHNIDPTCAPNIYLSQLEKSDRNDWSYDRNRQSKIENNK